MSTTTRHIAELLHAYMTFRAGREGVTHDLPVAFYADAIGAGVRRFFGVEIVGEGLAKDTQQPALFAEWQATNRAPE